MHVMCIINKLTQSLAQVGGAVDVNEDDECGK